MLPTLDQLSQALAAHRPQTLSGLDFAAVALVLRQHKNEPEVLVIERSTHVRDPWSGHLAFPGGRQAPEDASLEATAIRETLEEVGLDLQEHAEFLGPLDHRTTHELVIPRLVVAPFVFAVRGDPALTLAPNEVERRFWVPLAPLWRGERGATLLIERAGAKLEMPGFDVEGRVLWGLSYQMLRSLLTVLV